MPMKKILKNNKMNNIRYLPARIAIAVFTCLILVAIMQWDNGLFKAEFREGDIALRDIFAPYDFNVRGDINTKATDKIKNEAVTSLPPVYIFDSELKASVLNKVKSVRGAIQVIKDASGMPDEKTLKVAEMSATYNISESLVKGILGSSDSAAFFKSAQDAVEEFMSKPIISTIAYLKLKDSGVTDITLLDKFTLSENGRKTKDLVTLEDAKNRKPEPFSSNIKDRKERLLFVDFVNAILAANVNYDEEITRARKEALIQNIQPVYNKIEVKKNEILLNKGERIGKLHVEKLKALEQGESFAAKISGLFGVAIVVGLFMLFLVLYMKIFDPVLMSGVKDLALLSVICILIISTAKIIVNSPWPSSMVPVAVAPMLIALLINSRLAIVFAFFLSVLIGMISGNILDVTGVCLAGSIVGIFAMKGVRRRSQLIMAGLAVGFANMSYLIGMGLVRGLDFHAFISEALFGLLNGAMSAVIVTGVLPIFENVFKISTDISLLELADLNHPLLKRMVMEAPGTYHHSLVVGNLAEAACESIGANALLARVGSYFHDIGKLEKASYFSENQSVKKSAHDKLSPSMSSLIITNHVKHGVDLAQKHKLNKKIVDIIKQHHGTGLVFYFFKRALEKVPDEEVGEQAFRYPGPKPQTKEAACVLLADSVEAGSRALDDPTPSRIKGLVRKIINNKFIDGQLDECDLTLKNLERIAEVFIHILTGIFHTRVEYPDEPAKEKK